MSEQIEKIKSKYIVKGIAKEIALPKFRGNVQAHINKIQSIINAIRDKAIDQDELNRLESSVLALHRLIKSKHG